MGTRALVAVTVLVCIVTLSFTAPAGPYDEYVVVIDAGSSGSRVYVHTMRCNGGGDPGFTR